MPFQPVNYAGISPLGYSALRNMPQTVGQGMQVGMAPERERRAAEQSQLSNALQRMRMQYFPQEQQQKSQESALRQALMRAQAQRAGQQAEAGQMDMEQQRAFMDALKKHASGSDAPDEGEELKQSLTQEKGAYRKPENGYYSVAADSSDSNPGDPEHPEPPVTGDKRPMQVIEQGNPDLHWIDKMYTQNPQWRNMFEKRGYKMNRTIKNSPETGQAFETITYPSGKVESRAVDIGRSPEDIERGKGIAKSDSKVYDNALQGQQAASEVGSTLNYLNNVVKSNPEIKNAVGPANRIFAKYFGNEATQDALGAVNSLSANLMQQMASGFKGAFTGREQSLITESKPNAKDPMNVFTGKLNTLQQLSDLAEKRNKLIAQYYHKGMNPDDAIEKARKETDMTPFEQELGRRRKTQETASKMPVIAPNGKTYMIPSDKVDAALKAGGRRG